MEILALFLWYTFTTLKSLGFRLAFFTNPDVLGTSRSPTLVSNHQSDVIEALASMPNIQAVAAKSKQHSPPKSGGLATLAQVASRLSDVEQSSSSGDNSFESLSSATKRQQLNDSAPSLPKLNSLTDSETPLTDTSGESLAPPTLCRQEDLKPNATTAPVQCQAKVDDSKPIKPSNVDKQEANGEKTKSSSKQTKRVDCLKNNTAAKSVTAKNGKSPARDKFDLVQPSSATLEKAEAIVKSKIPSSMDYRYKRLVQ